MRLRYIELENFRQYHGVQTVQFAQRENRNVTLLYGANGSGKTTFLNAFMWALYGNLTEDVEESDRLVSDHAWEAASDGDRITVSVTVEFEHDSKKYLVKRSVEAQKQGTEQNLPKSKLMMWYQDESGARKEVDSARSQIDRILPERLSRFFFVNGERIEHLVRKDAYEEIQGAIKTLLGLETLDRAVDRLPKVAQKLRRKLKSNDDSKGIDSLTDSIDEIDQQVQEATATYGELRTSEQSFRDEITLINNRLAAAAETKALQKERTELEAQQEKVLEAQRNHQKARDSLVGHHGYLAFLGGLAAQVHRISDHHRERGDLPAPLKATFIADLLEAGRCICGTELVEGTDAWSALEGWRTRIGQADVDEAWHSLHGVMGTFEEGRNDALERLREVDVDIAKSAQERRALDGRISEISAAIKAVSTEENQESLESAREEFIDRLAKTSREIGRIKDRIDALTAERAKKEREIEQLNIKGEANNRVQHRIAVVKEVEHALRQVRDIASDTTRRRLEQRIRDIFIPVSLKKYEPRLTEQFQLEYWQQMKNGEKIPAPKSTGENMLLSLSFVAAVAAECREGADRGALFPGVGGEFPIVMDAAFGNLDDDYRRHIARFLPGMTSQVVVLTSKAQASGVVENELQNRVGEQYVITTHTTKTNLKEVTEKISVAGRDYHYQVIGSHWDGAELTGVQP